MAEYNNLCGTCNRIQEDPKEVLNVCPECGNKAYYLPVTHTKRESIMRHPDFEKIYKQFLLIPEGLKRYSEWIRKLNLDESKPYGRCFKEGWQHRHIDFQKWKTDPQATYWKVEVGFPVESMNRNVYSKQELMLASRTLKDGYVNMNHKFPLPTITIPAAEAVTHKITLPDGTETETVITEAIVRVPNTLKCPICHTEKTINQLIEEGGIVNVSLEASCNYVSDDNRCEGMNFDGFAFLTSRVLPGIPLTRIQPLESIMVEALQTEPSIAPRRVKNVKKVMMEVKEEDCSPDQKFNPETGKCEPMEQIVDTKGMDDKAILPDEAGQCPPGYILSTVLGQCIPDQNCPEGSHFDQQLAKCVPDTVAAPTTPTTPVGNTPAPKEATPADVTAHTVNNKKDPIRMTTDTQTDVPKKDVKVPQVPTDQATQTIPQGGGAQMELPSGTPPLNDSTGPAATEPTPNQKTCPDGYVWDANTSMCMPSDPISERVERMKAEDRAKYFEGISLEWQKRLRASEQLSATQQGRIAALKEANQSLERKYDEANRQLRNAEITAQNWHEKWNKEVALRETYKNQNDALVESNRNLTAKYQEQLDTNLKLSKQVTQANEDYLDVAKQKEALTEKLGKARNEAKKIVRIKA